MECLIGIAFKNFTLLATDKTAAAHGILVVKKDDDKVFRLSDQLAMAVSGEPGDTVQFADFIAKNVQLYKMRNGYGMTPAVAAHYTRQTLAQCLRSRSPYLCNLLLAGWDEAEGGSQLFFLDYLGSLQPLPYAAHGYGGLFSLSVMDKYFKYDATLDEAVDIMCKCVGEVQQRLIVNLPAFRVHMVDREGTKRLDDISVHTLKEKNIMV